MPFALGFKDKMITRDVSGLRGYFWQGSSVNNELECDRMLSGPLSLKCTAFKEIIENENRMSISIYIFEGIEVRRYSSKRVGKLWNSHFTEWEREFTRNKDCCSVARVWFFATPWTAMHQVSLPFTISQSLLRFMSIESVMPSNHLILCHPLSSCSQSFPASRSFPVSWLFHQVAKVLELQLQHQSFEWIFRVDFL